MNKLLSASLALLLGWSGTALAQNEEDALRYTRLGLQGSARIQGIGGAQTALGADISSMSVNPAGLGMFRRSEASLSLGFTNNNTDARFMGSSRPDERTTFNIPQAGVVFSNRKDDNEGGDWRGTTFGIGISRLSNFNSRIMYGGQTSNTSPGLVEYIYESALNNGYTVESLTEEYNTGYLSLPGLAFGTYLLDELEDAQGKYYLPAERFGALNISEELDRRGSQNQFDLAFGTSFRDRVYLGASLGIVTSSFTQERIYRESEADPDTDFSSLELRDEFTTEGAGINLKVGVIVRPIDALRFGVSVQTPTAYSFTETYDRSLYSTFEGLGGIENYSAHEMPGEFSYQLHTPFKANTGVAVFVGKYGFITADAEYVDYSGMRFREDGDDSGYSNYFSDVNSNINDTYKSAMNYRIGAEGRYEVFRLRAGYNISGDPYKNSSFDGAVNTLTLGAGVRLQNYYADIAYARSTGKSRYAPYTFDDPSYNPVVDLDQKQNNVMFTVGLNF